ncbi:hypothetical protein BJ912DRAFT_903477 [Pholiota molesta]|nr:hypothetical protein BJ912DRAFT_903477 [Pholiota molesta]
MPIRSGRYFIINCHPEASNLAYLPNPNSAEPVEARFQQNEPGEQWDVINRKNGHHSIQNFGHKNYAQSGSRSKVGAVVTGMDSKQGGQMWLIQKTRGEEQSYTISTTDSLSDPFLGWGIVDNQQGTKITLSNVPTDPRNWWVFKPVETGEDAEVDEDLDNGFRRRGNQIYNYNIREKDEEFKALLRTKITTAAFHNSAENFDPPQCHLDTRDAIMLRLSNSIENRKKWIIWLNGAAGAGKTAIMHSLAKKLKSKGIHIATFFFNRTDPKRNKMGPLIATLADQLMRTLPQTQYAIIAAIERNPHIFDQCFEDQLQQLIVDPLILARDICQDMGFLLVMIDGLDECFNRGHQSSLIKILGETPHGQNIPLLFLVSSRREPHIQMSIEKYRDISMAFPLDDYVEEAREDIRRYVNAAFHDLRNTHPHKDGLSEGWPEPSAIDKIVATSSGQFIYVSIVIKYISQPDAYPPIQLDIINGLKPRDPSMEHPLANLDTFYSHIFEQVEKNKIRDALGILAFPLLAKESRVDLIEWAYGFPSGEFKVQASLANLTSVITCKGKPPLIDFLHASLPDFLLDKSRSGEYHIGSDHSTRLACDLLKLPTEPVRERDRITLLISLLGKASATIQLYESLLSYHFTLVQGVDTADFPVNLCMDFFRHFDRLVR